MMKKAMMLLAGLWMLAAGTEAQAQHDRRQTRFADLPAAAQQFVKENFGNTQISHIKSEGRMIDRDYQVTFADGSKIEFDKNGQWDEIWTRYGKIPASVLPAGIRTYLREHYPDLPLRRVERDRKGYELELGSGLELDFSPNGRLLKASY